MQSAIEAAMMNNYEVRISKNNETIAARNNTWGEAGRMPNVNFSVVQQNNSLTRNNPTSFINGTLTSSDVTGSLDASMLLFGGFQVKLTKDQLNLLESQSGLNTKLVLENTIKAVILSYHQCLLLERNLELLKESMALSKLQIRLAAAKFENGTGSSFDLKQFENAYLEDSISWKQLSFNLQTSKQNLNYLMGRKAGSEFTLVDSIRVPGPLPDSAFDNSESNNLLLQNSYLNIELQEKTKSIAQAVTFPTLSMNTGLGGNRSSFQLDNNPRGNGRSYNYYVNFTLNFNLFNGGKSRRAIQNALTEISNAEISRDDQLLQVRHEIFKQNQNNSNLREILELRETQIDKTNDQLEAAKIQYEASLISSIDYRNVQLSLLQAKYNYTQTIYNLIESQTELLGATGTLLSGYQ